MSGEPRDRVLAATVECAGRVGLSYITVDEVARASGLSRATVYRWFPGGRDQLVDEAVTWEVGRFLNDLATAVAGAPDLATRLTLALHLGHRAIDDHEVLQSLLRTEPGLLLGHLQATIPLAAAVVRDELAALLASEPVREGVDVQEAAEYLSRLFLSLIADPGRWDLDDLAATGRLVRERLLAGILVSSPPGV